jgi:hypothetical protein
LKNEIERDEIQFKNLDSIYHDHVVSEKNGLIPLTTVVDEEVTNSSHHHSQEIEQKIFDDISQRD